MEIRQLSIEDAYRELNNIVGVVAVMADGPGSLCVEHKNVHSDIEEFLDGTTWTIIDADDLAGRYPRVYVAPGEQPDRHRRGADGCPSSSVLDARVCVLRLRERAAIA